MRTTDDAWISRPPPEGNDLVVFLGEARGAVERARVDSHMRPRRRRSLVAGGLAALVLVGGGSAVAANQWFGVTPDGRTYGKTPDGAGMGLGLERQPDLVAVYGDHGVEGYVSKESLNAPFLETPSSPEGALRAQAERRKNPIVLPVFAEDGTTQVDTFTLGKGFREHP
jgi:hypothetical protein